MPIPVTIPRLGWSMEEGTFVRWLKADGQAVRAGEPLFELEGEKAIQEIESIDEGVLHIPVEGPAPGSVVAVGALLGYLLAPGETPPSAATSSATKAEGAADVGAALNGAPSAANRGSSDSSGIRLDAAARADESDQAAAGGPVASPRARRAARRLGVDWRQVPGGGATGRIRERDVVAAAESSRGASAAPRGLALSPNPQAAGEVLNLGNGPGRLIPVTPLRRTIAQRMVAACQFAAPVTLTTRCDVSGVVKWRERLRASSSVGDSSAGVASAPLPTYTDLLVRLTADTLADFPLLNASWTDDGIFVPEDCHIGIAVDTPKGLVVPVLRQPRRLDLAAIASQTKQLAARAREGRLTADEVAGGTFTITNLGMLGVDAFTPLLNLPQAAILGVGRIVREPVVRGESLAIGHVITLSLTFDHRVLDGAEGARFLQALSQKLEQWSATG